MSKLCFAFLACASFAVGCNRGGGGGEPQVVPLPDARTPEAGTVAALPDAKPTPPVALRAPEQHRATAEACDRTPPPPGRPDPKAMGCKSDKECTEGKNGRCVFYPGGHAMPHNACESNACFDDDDCKSMGSKVCTCGGGRGARSSCMQGNCRVDADCGGAGQRAYCSPSTGDGPMGACAGTAGYYCRTEKDTCVEDADCKEPGTSCAFQPLVGRWTCLANRSCPVG